MSLDSDATFAHLRNKLARLADLPPARIVFVEVLGGVVSRIVANKESLRGLGVTAYEIVPPQPIPEEQHLRTATADVGMTTALSRTLAAAEDSKSTASGASGETLGDESGTDLFDTVTPRASHVASPALSSAPSLSNVSMSDTAVAGEMGPGMDMGMGLAAAGAGPELAGALQSTSDTSSKTGKPLVSAKRPPRRVRFIRNHFTLVQRRMEQVREHFLLRTAHPQLFGTPRFVPYTAGQATWQELYANVWQQLSRFVDATLREEVLATGQYPFRLVAVSVHEPGSCGVCSWTRHCLGRFCFFFSFFSFLLLFVDLEQRGECKREKENGACQ